VSGHLPRWQILQRELLQCLTIHRSLALHTQHNRLTPLRVRARHPERDASPDLRVSRKNSLDRLRRNLPARDIDLVRRAPAQVNPPVAHLPKVRGPKHPAAEARLWLRPISLPDRLAPHFKATILTNAHLNVFHGCADIS